MTQLWMDGFDHYGSGAEGRAAMLNGAWDQLEGSVTLAVPAAGARTGPMCLRLDSVTSLCRRALGTTTATLIAGLGYYCDALPDDTSIHYPMIFRTAANANVCYLTVRPDGAIEARDGAGTILGVTTGPVINAGSWQHIEMKAFRSATVGTIEVRVDEVTVLSLNTLNLGAVDFGIFAVDQGGGLSDPNNIYFDDIVVRDALGTVNNDFEGDLRVATLQPVANGANQGWSTRSLEKLGIGVMDFTEEGSDAGIMYNDDPAFEIGSGDFCIEGFVRFADLLVTTEISTIFSKWKEDTNECSWRLVLTGPDNGNNLEFSTSALGTLADEVVEIAFGFIPVTMRWYHIAIARESGVVRLYIDGVKSGGDNADARTYYDGAADLVISGKQNGASTLVADTGVNGWMDGVRFTVGAARYTAERFAVPTDVLPNDVTGDPLYNSVELLLNFDDVDNTDESANAFVDSLIGGANIFFPDDDVAYQTIDGETPLDYDFVEAELVSATGTLTLTGQPLDTETVTLGSVTYTFQTVLTAVANNVLIGADAEESLDNLLAAINQELGEGTKYGTGTVFNPDAYATDVTGTLLLATARTAGVAGNTVASTETLTNGSWSNATLLGGLDIPTNSEFTMGNLPADVTGINALAVVTRSFKTDTGTSELTVSFVKDGGFAAAGAARALPTSPTYFEDTHETDPETAGALTPSTMVNSRIRLDRTA